MFACVQEDRFGGYSDPSFYWTSKYSWGVGERGGASWGVEEMGEA